MRSLDDSGKVLIWASESVHGDDVNLGRTQLRGVRIAEKWDFVKMMGGKLV